MLCFIEYVTLELSREHLHLKSWKLILHAFQPVAWAASTHLLLISLLNDHSCGQIMTALMRVSDRGRTNTTRTGMRIVGNTIWKSTTYEMYVLDLQWIIAAVLFEYCFAGNVNWSGCIDLPNKAHKSRCSFGRLYIKLAVITSDGKKGVYYSGLFYVGVIFTLTLSSRWLPRPRCST